MADPDAVDLSHLLAFADTIDALGGLDFADLDIDDASPKLDLGGFEATVDWIPPRALRTPCRNNFADVIDRVRDDYDSTVEPASSPESPTQKARTSLFNVVDQPIDILVCGESLDPRGICVLDHPGRHAHFKHWLSNGLLVDDTRRSTLREESSRPNCWQEPNQQETDLTQKSVLGLLLSNKNSAVNSPEESRNTTPAPLDLVEVLRKSRSSTPESLPSPAGGWKDKCFMMGKHVMVAMADSNLSPLNFRNWCLFFNDMLCSWGLNDKSMVTRGPVFLDVDFSRNAIDNTCISELQQLLSAFKRLKVRNLRLCSNELSDESLGSLMNLPYMQQMYVDHNNFTSQAIREYITSLVRVKQDYYEGLVAQDAPDEAVLQTFFISVDHNRLSAQLALMDQLRRDDSLTVCDSDSTACEPGQPCRMFGTKCTVHLAGLGSQRPPIYAPQN
jgi:hypothetical protein